MNNNDFEFQTNSTIDDINQQRINEIKNTYSFYAQMSQPKEFLLMKQTFEIIKDIVSDGTLIVNESGIKINKMTTSGEALVYAKFDASKLSFYYCPEEMEIGLDFITLYKRLKQFSNNDPTAFYMKKNSSYFGITSYITEKKKTLNYEIIVMNEIEKENIKIPETRFKSVIVISSNEFKTICSNALQVRYVNIEYSNHQLIFHAKGNEGKFYCVLDEIERKEDDNVVSEENNEYTTYQGRFDTELLCKFSKASQINDQMRMLLKNGNALIIQYEIGSIGCLRFCLGEKEDEDHDDNLDDLNYQNYNKWGSQYNKKKTSED